MNSKWTVVQSLSNKLVNGQLDQWPFEAKGQTQIIIIMPIIIKPAVRICHKMGVTP